MRISDWSSDVCSSDLRYGHGNPISESSADDWALTALHREVDSETERRFDAVGARIAEPFDQRAEEVALIALDIGVVEQVARKDCGFPAAILGAERDPCIGVAKALQDRKSTRLNSSH